MLWWSMSSFWSSPSMPVGLFELVEPAALPEAGGEYAYVGSREGDALVRVPVAPGLADGACSDGSDPVFYVRAAPAGSPHARDWLVFLQGGGSSWDGDDVVERWTTGDHGEMSSRWAPPAIWAVYSAKAAINRSCSNSPNRPSPWMRLAQSCIWRKPSTAVASQASPWAAC